MVNHIPKFSYLYKISENGDGICTEVIKHDDVLYTRNQQKICAKKQKEDEKGTKEFRSSVLLTLSRTTQAPNYSRILTVLWELVQLVK